VSLKKIAPAAGLLAVVATLGALLLLRHQPEMAVDLRAPIPTPTVSSTPEMPWGSALPQPAQSSHFLPQLPPPQLVPRKPSLFEAPAKARTGKPT
jgi:hypothetical protein